ncbi:trypsin, alkaline C-like [Nymphalis io]|uniref:trypsin, alkaline C-like n=1 Tax=Inachis io TaxID=171585 RepID=UPI002169113E|nr:trypsin, alkaline C-like [Nymphalis io]
MFVITLLALVGAAIAAPSAFAPFIVEGSAPNALAPRIVGGTDANIEDYPFMANILIAFEEENPFPYMSFCGGSLITSRSVLTAAHCLMSSEIEQGLVDKSQFRVRLGSSLPYTGGHLHRVESLLDHPGYAYPKAYHDIGILKLATPAILSDCVALAPIAGPNYWVPDNTTLTTAGWGTIQSFFRPAEILQQVDIKMINHDFCRENYAKLQSVHGDDIPNVTSEMVCAGLLAGGKGVCYGDSGGPLLHQGVVIGITSWGQPCARAEFPGVFVNVPSYTSWIVDNA